MEPAGMSYCRLSPGLPVATSARHRCIGQRVFGTLLFILDLRDKTLLEGKVTVLPSLIACGTFKSREVLA